MSEQNGMNKEEIWEQHAEFLAQHQDFYDQLVRILGSCVERDDIAELTMHITYIGQCISQAFRLRLIIQQQEQRSGKA